MAAVWKLKNFRFAQQFERIFEISSIAMHVFNNGNWRRMHSAFRVQARRIFSGEIIAARSSSAVQFRSFHKWGDLSLCLIWKQIPDLSLSVCFAVDASASVVYSVAAHLLWIIWNNQFDCWFPVRLVYALMHVSRSCITVAHCMCTACSTYDLCCAACVRTCLCWMRMPFESTTMHNRVYRQRHQKQNGGHYIRNRYGFCDTKTSPNCRKHHHNTILAWPTAIFPLGSVRQQMKSSDVALDHQSNSFFSFCLPLPADSVQLFYNAFS